MKKYVVEIVEKITYKVSLDAASSEDAENAARRRECRKTFVRFGCFGEWRVGECYI